MLISETPLWRFYLESLPNWSQIHLDMCKTKWPIEREREISAEVLFFNRAPFDSAIISFVAMCILLITSWSENHGDAHAPASQSFLSAWKSIKSGSKKNDEHFCLVEFFSRSKNLSLGHRSSLIRSIDVRFRSWMDTCSNWSIKQRICW